ncbi:MAG TPA: hypothetical protein VFP89_04870 [Propionibacteriaceae bacterium]|nr:hypothetical protein [Propionibacteriaceae bacterium]
MVAGTEPVLRPARPEPSADNDIGNWTDHLAHQLALLGAKGIDLPQARALDNAVDRAPTA